MKKRFRILPRFGLRSILVLTTLVAVICGGWLRQAQVQRDVCDRLKNVGIEVFLDKPVFWLRWLPNSVLSMGGGHYLCPVTEIDLDADAESPLRRNPRDNDLLVWVSKLSSLKRLQFNRLLVDSADFPLLEGCGLEELDLSFLELVDEDISRLPKLPKLRYLNLSGNLKLTGKHVDYERFPSLQRLYCDYSELNDDSLHEIGRLQNLESLGLEETNVTDRGLAAISMLKKLENIHLADTNVTGIGIGALHGLASVDLSNTDVVDEAFTEIAKLPNLTNLSFSGCVFVTDKGIKALAHHGNLSSVVASSCGITDASTEALSTIGSLEHLWLDDTYVRSLAALAACKKLKRLSISSQDVPIEDVLLFSKHKECSIQIQDPSNEREQLSFLSRGCASEPIQYVTSAELASMAGETIGGNGDSLALHGLVGLSAKYLKNFGCDIDDVSLARSQVHGDVFKFLRNWPMLKSLDATMCTFTEADLQEIGELRGLTSLELGGTEIDDRGMRGIQTLSKLRMLSLGKTRITPESLETIKCFKQLRLLTLPFIPDANFLIEVLEACPGLISIEVSIVGSDSNLEILSQTALRLHNIELTADQLDRLLGLHSQRTSETSIVAGQKLNDQHCAILANSSSIEELDLSSSNVTDVGIAHLAKLPELDTLNISDTSVTAVGLRSLQPKHFIALVCAPRTWSIDFVEALLEFKELSELSIPFSEMPPEVALAFASGSLANKLAGFVNGLEWGKRFCITEDDINWMVGRSPFNTNSAQLTLLGSLIDDAKVAEVTASPTVEYVHVKDVCCKAEALLAKLLACRNVKQLSLSGVQLTPSDIQRLAELEHLESLKLANCELNHDHFAQLSRLSKLSTLWLSGDFANSDGLLSLTKLSRLRKLTLMSTCSTEKYEELQRQLGKRCEIMRVTR